MKKSLFAIAAVGALAGAAQAQSSVTVYGILDVGYLATRGTEGRNSTAGSSTAAGYVNGGTLNSSAFNAGNLATSRLGFRGVEDLGGGLSASFVAEIGLTPSSNGFSGSTNASSTAMGSTYVNNNAAVDNRQSFVGLSQKGLGTARIGRQYTPVHEVVCATNVGQCNAVAGDMIYSGSNSTNTKTLANQLNDSYQIRAANAITFRTENIAGFQAAALYSLNARNNSNSGVTGDSSVNTVAGQGVTDYRMMGANATFTGIKNLNVSVAWQQTNLNRDQAAFVAAGTANVLGSALYSLTPAAQAAIVKQQTDAYGNVSYDFGIAKVAIQYVSLKTAITSDKATDLTRTATQIGVSAPVTKQISAWGSYGKGKRSAGTNGAAAASSAYLLYPKDFAGFQLGTTYDLSKRTSLYAIYGQSWMDAQTAGNVNFKDQQYALGVKHTF